MTSIEAAEPAPKLINHTDFVEFGHENGFTANLPTRTWFCLAKLRRDAYYASERPHLQGYFGHVCLVYRSDEYEGTRRPGTGPFEDLEAPSLVQFVSNVNDILTEDPKRPVPDLLGRNYGPRVLEFLNRFVEQELGTAK